MHLTQTKNLLLGLDEWVLLDKSETGFGVDLGREPSPWVEAGKLVGFQHPSQQDAYVIAEIKHVKRQKNGTYRAGLQLISLHSLSMQLIKLDQTQVELSKGFYLDYDESDADLMRVSCVWIPPSVGQTQVKSSVIIPINEYQRNRQFKIDINGEENAGAWCGARNANRVGARIRCGYPLEANTESVETYSTKLLRFHPC